MFAHLVIHATECGRLDTGPLALIDLDRPLQREQLDWPVAMAEAQSARWLPSAALLQQGFANVAIGAAHQGMA